MLIIAELAVVNGLRLTSSWVLRTGADLFVEEAGTKPLASGISAVPPDAADRIRAIPGVEGVIELDIRSSTLMIPGVETGVNALLTAWSPGALTVDVVRGRIPVVAGEIVVDEGFARMRNLEPGSRLTIRKLGNGEIPGRVVGTTRGASMVIFQTVFTPLETISALRPQAESDAGAADRAGSELTELRRAVESGAARFRDLALDLGLFAGARAGLLAAAEDLDRIARATTEGQAALEELEMTAADLPPTTLAVVLDSAADPRAMAAAVGEVPGVVVYLPEEYRQAVESGSVGPFIPVLGIVVAIAMLVGTLVLGMTLSTMVTESVRDYAVLRSLGRTRWALRGTVLGQGTYVVGTALLVGAALGTLAIVAVTGMMPLLPITLTAGIYAAACAAALAMLLVGGLLPIRRVLRVDPASVFRA
ncbi:MAG: ABC transporter permease [Acidimicrobiia bacterium]|nr:ABC transporter permease [Acidimicrobiia bacterium]